MKLGAMKHMAPTFIDPEQGFSVQNITQRFIFNFDFKLGLFYWKIAVISGAAH